MQYGICLNSLAALREEASHKSQLVSQLLFGDLFEVIEKKDDWLYIITKFDNYCGWVAENQVKLISDESFSEFIDQSAIISGDIIQVLTNVSQNNSFLISAGSTMYGVNPESFKILGDKYRYNGKLSIVDKSASQAVNNAMMFLNSPYLWGGRSSMGIDCSALVQVAYKMTGIKLPRDSSVQVEEGFPIHLINEAQAGDLCFFSDFGSEEEEEAAIIHVGMLIDEHHIIHAHGNVRIDLIDHNGIFSKDLKKYTHKLRLIKRV